MRSLFESGQTLYHQDRFWRLLFEIIVAAFLALLLIATVKYMFGNSGSSNQPIQASSSYKPLVPPGALGGSSGGGAGGSQSGRVITMPATQQNIESDERLKQLHISTQGIDSSLNKSERCEQLVTLLSPITSYDRKRTKTVHKGILAEGDSCKSLIIASDARLSTLKTTATLAQENNNASNSIALVNAMDAITNFDQERGNYTQYKHFSNLGANAKERKTQSDALLLTLQESVNAYSSNTKPDTESKVIQQFEKLSSFDLERPEPHHTAVLAMAQDITNQAQQRSTDLQELKELQDIFSGTNQISVKNTERAAKLASRFAKVPNTLLSSQQRTDIVRLTELSANYQIKQLQRYAENYKQQTDNTTLQILARQLIRIETDYSSWLQDIDATTLSTAREAKRLLRQSDARLQALITASTNVNKNMNQTTIKALLKAEKALVSLDLSRLSHEHKEALKVSKNARSGVLESNVRIKAFTKAYNTYKKNGCTKFTLSRLRQAREKLNDFDLSQGSSAFLDTINISKNYLRRNYCIESKVKTLKPI